jgi:hypothetical protein
MEPLTARDIDGKTERSNGREHMSQCGRRASFNGATGRSDIEGKATRVVASDCGRRASFNGATGRSDIEGKATRVVASECGRRASFN